MKKGKVFIWLAGASGFIGIGMMFGYTLGNSTDNKALWIGGLLLLLGAVLLGMSISSQEVHPRPSSKTDSEKDQPEDSSS